MVERSIKDCLAGKHVLVTGVTGFVGKVLLEKLLRCNPEIARLYVLIRERKQKKGREEKYLAATRFEKEVSGSPIFDRLRREIKNGEWSGFENERVRVTNFDEYVQGKVCP